MILKLLTFPVDSLLWIAEQVQDRAIAELEDQQNLSKQLLKLQIQIDMGEISEAEFMEQEQKILAQMEAEYAESIDSPILSCSEDRG